MISPVVDTFVKTCSKVEAIKLHFVDSDSNYTKTDNLIEQFIRYAQPNIAEWQIVTHFQKNENKK